jgi:hypothetical protein
MVICETTDFIYPLKADIYYPIVEQQAYGNLKKTWVLDRTFACSFAQAGTADAEDVKPNVKINQESLLIGRSKTDLRISSHESKESITNIIITNIRTAHDSPIYLETAGPRSGKSTIFEIATQEPVVGPFGSIEYYKLIVRRSENQASDL